MLAEPATLCYEQKFVFVGVRRVEVDLGGKVATGVYFVPHIKRGVLRIAQIFLGVAVVNALGEVFLVAGVCPY